MHINTGTLIHRHSNTQTHINTDTNIHRHTYTQTQVYTDTHMNRHKYILIHRHTYWSVFPGWEFGIIFVIKKGNVALHRHLTL